MTWRVSLHSRQFQDTALVNTEISGIDHARGRRLERTLNKSATFSFTVDGRSDVAGLVQEMETDVVVWRTSEATGNEVMYGRFLVAQSEDQVNADSHTTTFTCHDYFAMLARRYLAAPVTYTQSPQGNIVGSLLALATTGLQSTNGTKTFMPGSYLPLTMAMTNADGSAGSSAGPLRDRTYVMGASVGQLIDDLAHVQGSTAAGTAFDYDVRPLPGRPLTLFDTLRIFNDGQGVNNPNAVLEYGGNVSALTRTANSASPYANHVRVIGKAATAGAAPMYSEAWQPSANDIGVTPVGVWQDVENASDVSIQSTLDQAAAGYLNLYGVLVPSYTLTLRPGTYAEGWLQMGDTVPLVVQSGRLDVVSSVRIVGMSFDISEDGPEVVTLTVGRPPTSLVDLLNAGAADVNTLARR